MKNCAPAGLAPSSANTAEAEIAHARRIVEAFVAEPGAGALALDGKMIDIPHLKAARKALASV